ncbi:MAG: hypothetical protein OXU73_02275 [Candidatus Campbellbacteria bacterium]|nr:hypothetical protein [Candidatus Campbellbacteria bacterium]
METLDTEKLQTFISAIPLVSREVGLIIAENMKEMDGYSNILEMNGMTKLSSFLEYKNVNNGYYIVVNEDNFKQTYDFVCQYPSTIISLFDPKTAETIVIHPNYTHPVIVLIEKDDLNTVLKNFDLFGRVGLVYRPKNFLQ